MKIWKKTACLALCTVMSLGVFAGCGEEGENSEATRREKAQASAKKYVETVSDTLETVKSFNVSGKVNVNVKEEDFIEGTTSVDPAQTEETKMTFYLDVTLTQDGEDNVALSMTAKSEEIEVEFGETEVVYQSVVEVIVKDGYSYDRTYMISSAMTDAEKEEQKGLWTKAEITMPEEMPPIDSAFVNSLLNAKEIKEFGAQLLGGAQEIITEKFFNDEVTGGKVSWSADLAPDFNEVIAFVESIDESKDTLGGVINKVLAEITDNVTVESILAKVKEYKDKTVTQALTEIDAELAKKDTSLQGIYDAIVNSEVLTIILTEAGMPAEYFVQMKAFKIESLKAQFGMMTLGQVVNMIVEEMNGEGEYIEPATTDTEAEEVVPTDYASEALAMVEALMGVTLAELEIELPTFLGTQFNEISIDTGLQLNAAGDALEKLYLSIDLDIRGGNFMTEYGETGVTHTLQGYDYLVVSADLTISSFSQSTVVINAPAADQVQSPSME